MPHTALIRDQVVSFVNEHPSSTAGAVVVGVLSRMASPNLSKADVGHVVFLLVLAGTLKYTDNQLTLADQEVPALPDSPALDRYVAAHRVLEQMRALVDDGPHEDEWLTVLDLIWGKEMSPADRAAAQQAGLQPPEKTSPLMPDDAPADHEMERFPAFNRAEFHRDLKDAKEILTQILAAPAPAAGPTNAASGIPRLDPIIFSAPFGNYMGGPGITSTIGTFTFNHRAGRFKRLWRVVKTVRYSPLLGAWVNRLGLPNPGVTSLKRENPEAFDHKLVSIHGFNFEEWERLIDYVSSLGPRPLGIEMNVSCPNVADDPPDYKALFRMAARESARPLVVKIPPVGYARIVDAAVDAGIRMVHACNTLPVARGGLSGKPLMSISLRVVESLRARYPALKIIGGGGITHETDLRLYRSAGADHFAIGSALFFPWVVWRWQRIARRRD